MKYVKTAKRYIEVSKIPYALIHPGQAVVFPVDYHMVALTGNDAQTMIDAMKAAGFVGEGTMINPSRVSVVEDAGTIMKVFLEGADRVVNVSREIASQLFPAPETGEAPVEKTRKKKAELSPIEKRNESQNSGARGSLE